MDAAWRRRIRRPARERERDALLNDVRAGKVTAAGAKNDYGVDVAGWKRLKHETTPRHNIEKVY